MRAAPLLLLFMIASSAQADSAIQFLDMLCLRSFGKTTMPVKDSQRFCGCVRSDIAPQLSDMQRSVLALARKDFERGRAPNQQQIASSGVRDLLVAAQARCEASFYPPSAPINVAAGGLQLTLRCEADTRAPAAFIYIKNGALLSSDELRAADKKMMNGQFDTEFALVAQRFDGVPRKAERWEIDLTGEIVSPPKPAELIYALRRTTAYEVVVERGQRRHTATFQLAGKIPLRWMPCGGVGR